MNSSFIIVSIEGNIGSGKSTLLANLRSYYESNSDVIFLKEPVDEWEKIKDENGTTILEKFYGDQDKYSFPFQMMAYVSRLKVLRDALKGIDRTQNRRIVIITERSLYTDKMVFAKMLYDSQKIELINYKIYLNWFDTFSEEFPVNKVVYVKTDPEICHSRIMKRSREGESNIPLEYLQNCNNYHNNMLDVNLADCVCHDQLILDGNVDIYENADQLVKWINEIEGFISN
jgi:deoxyadenosine/deoxycytidine kinase